jgi:hypothetical protein
MGLCGTTIVSRRSETEEVDLSSVPRKAVLFLLALCGQTLGAAAQTSEIQTTVSSSKVVLELFTSQGCSSCPSADALLQSYTKRDDVIALSVPVDYWDRLGWKDTFASPQHSLRQRAYASTRGDGQVYTPQIVVAGSAHVVGSSRSSIDAAIAAAKLALREPQPSVQLRWEGDVLVVNVGAAQAGAVDPSTRLLLAVVQDFGTVAIGRGENANQSVTYYNIVRSLRPIGSWNGTPSMLRLSNDEVAVDGTQSVVVLLQKGAGGPILAAAQLRRASRS